MIEVIIYASQGGVGLEGCLESTQFASVVWVIGRSPGDGVRQLAEQHGARVLDGDLAELLSSGTISPELPWVLFLEEADRVTLALKAELEPLVFQARDIRGYRIRNCLMFGEEPLRWGQSGLDPLRLVRREWLMEACGDGDLEPSEVLIGELTSQLDHQLMPGGVRGWLAEQATQVDLVARRRMEGRSSGGYAEWEKVLMGGHGIRGVEMGVEPSTAQGSSPWGALMGSLFAKGGFLDGRTRFTVAILTAVHEFLVGLRMKELREECGPHGLGQVDTMAERRRMLGAVMLGLAGFSVVVLIFFCSWLPDPKLGQQLPLPEWLAVWVDADKNWNIRTAVPFLALGLVAGAYLLLTRANRLRWLLTWGATVVVALIAELVQLAMPHRQCDIFDILWATVGSGLGLGLLGVLGSIRMAISGSKAGLAVSSR